MINGIRLYLYTVLQLFTVPRTASQWPFIHSLAHIHKPMGSCCHASCCLSNMCTVGVDNGNQDILHRRLELVIWSGGNEANTLLV